MDSLALRSCHCCGRIHDVSGGAGDLCCSRCATALGSGADEQRDNGLSVALALSALCLYIPAATLPFLRISRLGMSSESSLLTGIFSLLKDGHLFVGSVVLLFSILLPLVKLGLILVLGLRHGWLETHHRQMTYRLVEHLGRWGMLDVLLVAVIIAFIKLGSVVSFSAGIGLPLFASFVVLSLLAGVTFNPHLLWSAGDEPASAAPTPSPPITPPAVVNGPSAPPPSPASSSSSVGEFPKPVPHPSRGKSRWWIWILPLLTLAGVVGVSWRFLGDRGRVIELSFADGRGLAAGNELRHLGVPAGQVEELRLDPARAGVLLRVRLTPEAERLVRRGTRFWIVRPQFDVTGANGLDTVVGPKYLAMRPGPLDAPPESRFVGLEEPPLEDLDFPGGIDIVLQSSTARGLRAGLPVHYRHLRIGGVRSIGLSADGGAVEAKVYVRPEYRHLIRPESRFWNASGVNLTGGLTAFHLHVGPAETWLRGGIEMAVPARTGEPVEGGHRFELFPAAEREWLEWSPVISSLLTPIPGVRPQLLPAALLWTKDGWIWDSPMDRRGWVLVVEGGLLGVGDLLTRPAGSVSGTARLELPNRSVPFDGASEASSLEPVGAGGLLSFRSVEGLEPARGSVREPKQPEDGFVVTGESTTPQLIAAPRLKLENGVWKVDASVPLPAALHGAAFVAASDGAAIGILRIEGQEAAVIPLPGVLPKPKGTAPPAVSP